MIIPFSFESFIEEQTLYYYQLIIVLIVLIHGVFSRTCFRIFVYQRSICVYYSFIIYEC